MLINDVPCVIFAKKSCFLLKNKLSVWGINNFSVMVHVGIVVEYPYLSIRLFSDQLYTSKESMTLFKFNINKLTNVLKIPINIRIKIRIKHSST